jgi:LuxR family maltose regulon positive regulatory protein
VTGELAVAASLASATSGPSRPAPLIRGKLHAPVRTAGYVPRPRLDAQLARSLDEATRLTLVSASAGYGKSVAVAGWLAASGVPSAWLSLDAADNDPVRFLRYLLAALAEVRPVAARLDAASLEGRSPLEQAALLIDAMADSDDPFVLVLDDYHAVTAEAVHEPLREVVEHGPPFAHLVLVTREDPPFALPRLRAHGRLVEVRAKELRCTGEEVDAYLREVSGTRLDESETARLAERTEGWIAGLQLVGISLRDRPARTMVDSFASSRRHVLDYLASEVVERLDPAMRTLLVRASVAERFTSGLCDCLIGRTDGARLLAVAERMNLFLIPLDDTGTWYRFHHLFADYLRTLLEPDEERTARERAAAYLAEAGCHDEAIGQAIAAGAWALATELLEAHGRETYASGELSMLLGWLDALPVDAIGTGGELCALRAWSAFNVGRVADAVRVCTAAETAAEGGPVPGPLLAVRAIIAAFTHRPGAVELARAALSTTVDDPFYGDLARIALASGQLATGELASVSASARGVLATAGLPGRSVLVVPAMTSTASSLLYMGRRDEGEALCRRILEANRAEAVRLGGGTPYGLYWLGMMLYEAGEVEPALEEMERGWAAMGTFGFGRALLTSAVSHLALARLAVGEMAGAVEAVATVRRDAAAAGLTGIGADLDEIEARVRVLGGDLGAASRWADGLEAATPGAGADGAVEHPAAGWAGVTPVLTLARVRLAQGRAREAAVHLGQARAAAEAMGDVADLVSIDVLEAAVSLRVGDRPRAMRMLDAAVRRAGPARYVRRIVDDGRSLVPLLSALRPVAPAFVDEVIAAAAPRSRGVPHAASAVSRAAGRARPVLIEPLTDRELEVLRLIARGLSDAAIAELLVVSLATAKWHAAHIRAKLGVTSRTQAVLRAQELALV